MRDRDLAILGGYIRTLDEEKPLVSALVVKNGRIVYAGDDEGAKDWARFLAIEKLSDLGGASVLPGFCDAHIHFEPYAVGLQSPELGTATREEALANIARKAREKKPGAWITGWGWDLNAWGGPEPDARELDAAAPDNPVAIHDKSGHSLWANSPAMRIAGLSKEMRDPPGGRIARRTDGSLSGLFYEEAGELVRSGIPQAGLEELVSAAREAQARLNRLGITAIHDFDPADMLNAYQILRDSGELTLRVTKSIHHSKLNEAISFGLRSGLGDELLRIGAVKLYMDGALGPSTAWMLAPYEGGASDLGLATATVEEIRDAVFRANAQGIDCAIHAIGDRAVREILDIYEAALAAGHAKGRRNRVEHAQLMDDSDIGRIADLGLIASMQPLHATSDMYMAEAKWGARCRGAYAIKSQSERGAVLAFGSDCPVESPSPLLGIHAAVTRRRESGEPGELGWRPEQRISVREAVDGYTRGPAFATGLERSLGMLKPGYLADFVVLDRDLFSIDPEDIPRTRILGVAVDGAFVFD